MWLWASLWSKGIVSKIPCQALVLIPVSVLFLSTKRTLSQMHGISVTDRGSENWISCERGQENTSRKGKEYKDEGLKKHFCLRKTWVVLRVLLIVHNKDLCSLNYRLRACTVWLAMCFALFTATSKSQLLMKNRKKLKNRLRKHMKEQWCNSKEIQKQHKLNMRVKEDIGGKHASIF